VRSTPERPFDLEELFPELADYARTATRLHPRSGAPTARDSSVGGPLLWPADEPWPMCPGPHDVAAPLPGEMRTVSEIRRRRAAMATAIERALREGASRIELTDQEREPALRMRPADLMSLLAGGRPAPVAVQGGIALVPIAQLYARDIPDLKAPQGTDLLQVLWCPFDHSTHHGENEGPAVTLRWRDSSTVDRVLDEVPEPAFLEEEIYLPEPCVLHPEHIVDYPTANHLHCKIDRGLCERIAAWCRDLDGKDPSEYREDWPPNDARAYREISTCGTWKVGGLPVWGARDPWRIRCADCAADMVLLLQIPSGEWFDDLGYWVPFEDMMAILTSSLKPHFTGNPPQVGLPDGLRLQIFVCPESPDHPHKQYLN
jgi:hypothetical protein